ncbi:MULTISPECIES: anti-sigma factor domain-containing protein [unclassified Polaromonas]|uniref:anti-sigma factor n=1 Tax=unclassified Polaromonas TaxID=2638319 RepID=UPI0018C97A7C|nr:MULTISPECIES: anti-sigma factor [unclassified Polaromonas]MBG6073545.1 anti-sigma-K factor RskA [Polaromonas sp. CG_9.7]MBG6115547.1 anti-sigma-K factor RskA [Polaromonas sp. CG_9.2]MDH6185860.1 anti-sigma-K factor RskA [Polaromonas sp. CG_23.6]
MNIHKNPSLMEQLAASYALGTLRGGARRRFETLARDNATLRAAALIWQSRLVSVVELQPEVAPSQVVWKRIENFIQAEKQAQTMQAARSAPAVSATAGGGWWSSLGLWRGATAAGAFATLLAVVTGVNFTKQLNGQVQELSAKLSATSAIEYVAVLADDKANASILVTFDPKTQKLMLKRVGDFREQADKSLELWALPPGAAPKSLGVMSGDAVMKLTAANSDIRQSPVLAITLEPKGGVSPGSGPTGPVLFKGALIKTPE